MNDLGKTLVVLGAATCVLGLLLWSGAGRGLGHLPGDIHITRTNFSFHFPIVTCLLVSAILSLVLWFFRR